MAVVLEHPFSTAKSLDESYATILDLERVVPCVEGGSVLEKTGPSSVRAEIDIKMGAMGMTFTGPVNIESADAATRTVKIKANTRETLGHSYATGDITISLGEGTGTIAAIANVGGKAAGMGEGVIVNVLTDLVRSFSVNVGGA